MADPVSIEWNSLTTDRAEGVTPHSVAQKATDKFGPNTGSNYSWSASENFNKDNSKVKRGAKRSRSTGYLRKK
tara:strand:- start:84 stop:302 length:219 start_codon:yes stop_codon:yes gene_type:complete